MAGLCYSYVKKWARVDGGLWDAYIRARELAVVVDLNLPCRPHEPNEIGVLWRYRRPTDEDVKAEALRAAATTREPANAVTDYDLICFEGMRQLP